MLKSLPPYFFYTLTDADRLTDYIAGDTLRFRRLDVFFKSILYNFFKWYS